MPLFLSLSLHPQRLHNAQVGDAAERDEKDQWDAGRHPRRTSPCSIPSSPVSLRQGAHCLPNLSFISPVQRLHDAQEGDAAKRGETDPWDAAAIRAATALLLHDFDLRNTAASLIQV